MNDHIHMLIQVKPEKALSKVIRPEFPELEGFTSEFRFITTFLPAIFLTLQPRPNAALLLSLRGSLAESLTTGSCRDIPHKSFSDHWLAEWINSAYNRNVFEVMPSSIDLPLGMPTQWNDC